MINKSYSLKEIASWTASNSEVVIPALQRGLVWKPNQVELLWDSILRGFPIGSFMLSDVVEKGQSGKYYLMDGQQRYNAISIGFNTVPNARAVLWIDLEPPTNKNSTRLYWIKATTIPHPWGFKNDDDCNRLNTYEKRQAIEKFELQGNIYNREFSLKETWPVEAKCPIPLWCLLYASIDTDDPDAFLNKSIELFMATDFSYRNKINISNNEKDYLKNTLFPAFEALKDYRINCNHLSKEVMEAETKEDTIEQTTLEVLFTRLNTGGTAISRDDLNYSAIKAYWPSIKDTNDELAEKYMSPSKLVMLAFRLALTDINDDSLKNELSIRQIRSYARNEIERKTITELYKNHLKDILETIDNWLGIDEEDQNRTPSILRTSIARNSPDVYLLLMYFAYENIKSPIELTALQIRALAFCLHWFTTNNDKKVCVQEIFRRCKEGITQKNIQKGISRLMHDGKLLHIYNPKEVRGFVTSIGENPNWRVWNSVPVHAREFFRRIFWFGYSNPKYFEPKEMLLYAEREYINTHFANYDPARQDMWEEYNRPWDFDHIVAQDRVVTGYGTRGPYRDYDIQWCDCVGNFAAITLESNRSKNNRVDFSEYHANMESLIYDDAIEVLPDRELTYNDKASVEFAHITYNRFCNIYEKVYELIEKMVDSVVLSDTLLKRKEIFSKIVGLYPEAIIHYATPEDGNDNPLEREQDWTREWMGVGIARGDFMACIEWPATIDKGKPTEVECGIRKAIGTSVTNEKRLLFSVDDVENDNAWWYKCCVGDSLDLETIKKQLDYYLSNIQQVINSF